MTSQPDILKQICADKVQHINRNEHFIPEIVLAERAKLKSSPLGFCAHIEQKKKAGQPALIAEIKKASPSKGIIRTNFDPARLAMAYQQGGATCISVLTDTPYFKGADEDLELVKSTVRLPVLRKDFMLTPYQITESRALGADCILLIVAALDDNKLKELYARGAELGMDTLIEVHDKAELDRALALNPKMIGINARNLKTLQVDLQTLTNLVGNIPANILKIAESGIDSYETLSALHKAGFDGFLVGESLMRQDDVSLAAQKLLGKTAESA